MLNNNLMLFFTGFSRFSSNIQDSTKKALTSKKECLLEMLTLVDKAEEILVNEHMDLNEFGKLLDYTWNLKRGITDKISSNSIDDIYQKAIKAGALGGKLLGAGGGGFLLFYVVPEKQQAVMKAMSNLLHVPFEFEEKGSRVIYYNPENYSKKEAVS